MTIKGSQIREEAITNSHISSTAAIETYKLALSSDWRHPFYSSFAIELLAQEQYFVLDLNSIQANIDIDGTGLLANTSFPAKVGTRVALVKDFLGGNDTTRASFIAHSCLPEQASAFSGVTLLASNTETQDTLEWVVSSGTLVWSSGAPVTPLADGIYKLFNQDESSYILLFVEFASLPLNDTSFQAEFSLSQDLARVFLLAGNEYLISQEQIEVELLVPVIRSLDSIPYESFLELYNLLQQSSSSSPISFADLTDVTKLSGTELVTTLALASQLTPLGTNLIGTKLPRRLLGQTVTSLLVDLDTRSRVYTTVEFTLDESFVELANFNMTAVVSNSNVLSSLTTTERASMQLESAYYNGVKLEEGVLSLNYSTPDLSLVGTIQECALSDRLTLVASYLPA